MPEPSKLSKKTTGILPWIRKKIFSFAKYPCEKDLRHFAKTFLRILKSNTTHPGSVVETLLKTSCSVNATHIYLEPVDKYHQLLFRINGKLKRALLLQEHEVKKLHNILANQPQSLFPGKYNVMEGVISLHTASFKKKFSLFFIPRETTDSIIIAPLKNKVLLSQDPARNSKKATTTPNIKKKIFIWQMGKVGSLSIYNSLKKHSTPTAWPPYIFGQDDRWPIHNNLVQTHSIEPLYNALHYSSEEFVIISLVRDLVVRNISSIFQSMNFEEEWRNEYFIATRKEFKKFSYEKQEQELTKQLQRLNMSNSTLNWYDNLLRSHFYYPEIDKYFIDVYAKPFDQEKGYQIYQSKIPKVQMIIIRLEDMDHLENEIGSFMGLDNFRLIKTNISKTKWYQPIYKKFKSRYRPTEQELKNIYSSKFMPYFYSKSQIEQFMLDWMHCSKHNKDT